MGLDYHPKCTKLQTSHVEFADDIFIVAGATYKCFKVIKETLETFSVISGLKPNLLKSNVYFAVQVKKGAVDWAGLLECQ